MKLVKLHRRLRFGENGDCRQDCVEEICVAVESQFFTLLHDLNNGSQLSVTSLAQGLVVATKGISVELDPTFALAITALTLDMNSPPKCMNGHHPTVVHSRSFLVKKLAV